MAALAALLASASAVLPAAATPAAWAQSYKAGFNDSAGARAGGSEVLHLEGHAGKLYAANGYWEDTRNCLYGDDARCFSGWGQVLRLDAPGGDWQVELQLPIGYLRTESLKSLTFATDDRGTALAPPVTVLVAGAYSNFPVPALAKAAVWTRNAAGTAWAGTTIAQSAKGIGSVRALLTHRDSVTGVDRAFVTVGTLGIFSGVWVPRQGAIVWGATSESGPVGVRPLGLCEAGGALFFSSGARVYRRVDGAAPTWEVWTKMDAGGVLNPAIGGIRGLSAVVSRLPPMPRKTRCCSCGPTHRRTKDASTGSTSPPARRRSWRCASPR